MDASLSNPKPRELKPEQATAAHTLDRHLSVTAGPGAGKTFVLVERYLEILRTQRFLVDNIVAITFTNRAANEMRERVRETIDELLRQTKGDERQRWLRHKRALEGAVITTIHGFCSRLLHEFPVEANIDPQFVLLDEHQAVMLLEAAVEESLTNAIHHGREKIVQMTQGAGRSALAGALVKLYWEYRGDGLSLSEIEKLSAANHATETDYAAALKELDAAMTTLISAGRLSRGADEKRIRIAQDWPPLRAVLAQPPNEQTIGSYCQAIEDLRESRPTKNSAPGVERLDELLWGLKSGDRVRGTVPTLAFDLLARDYALAVLQLLREIEARLEAEKQRLSVVDFDDLQLRTLKLLDEHPEVMSRVAERYRFFLVDEFQDTNGLQRDLMTKLGMMPGANLFIVGDRKQSIYGFRGADVDVFTEMSAEIEAAGGERVPLHLNFRSQKPLIDSLNFLFERVFHASQEIPTDQLGHLGYVNHEPSIAERGAEDESPLVELLVSVLPDAGQSAPEDSESGEGDERVQSNVRERDAEQVVERINALVAGYAGILPTPFDNGRQDACVPKYGDIAILFRALTGVWVYESALRRAGIPYITVQGKGFYQREEITDLIQLLRFLDNTTDELALAAVLRSPLCGISDNALLALRCAPSMDDDQAPERLHRRNLRGALRDHQRVQFIDEEERADLDRASAFLEAMIQRRNRSGIAELLRQAVAETEYLTVIAANFDGAHRIANVEKLFRLAEQFERTGANLIRDFVNYVEEFEAVGGRESEGQMDKSADVVRLMTIHQAKGLEFPVVIIPDLHREPMRREAPFVLDRRKGLSLKVPGGRGQMVRGAFLDELQKRAGWREEFESMRVLYVAATRAEDRLIFSGAVAHKGIKNLTETPREHWLAWIWQALELGEHPQSEVKQFGDDVRIDVRIEAGYAGVPPAVVQYGRQDACVPSIDASLPFAELFPLLQPIAPERGRILRRFSVTQLINFQRCARQYYFDRMLRAPGAEELAAWNDAEAPEPPANLTATLKGAVIHRFCETFSAGDDPTVRLRASFQDVRRQREAELAGRAFDIDEEQAVSDLMPLAQNYLASDVFKRATAAQLVSGEAGDSKFQIPNSRLSSPGLWSELRFRLRRSLGILTGTIDKLLIMPAANGDGFDVELIDFKTNRFRAPTGKSEKRSRTAGVAPTSISAGVIESGSPPAQGFFDFETQQLEAAPSAPTVSLEQQIAGTARDYHLQMQAYALALRELLGYRTPMHRGSDRVRPFPESPSAGEFKINTLRATLHFIDPNVEVSMSSTLLGPETCARAIDDAMMAIASLDGTLDAGAFPTMPATHCRICNFRDLCVAGQDWLRQNR